MAESQFKVSQYAKFIVAVVGATVAAVASVISNDTVTSTEVVQVVLAFLTALGVVVVPNSE
jgi:hypothetical protein